MKSTDYLDLTEYPSPVTNETIYMVRLNGNHRTGVFRTIGLPYVNANIGKINSNIWYYKNDLSSIEKVLKLIQKLGLIDGFERKVI